MVSLHTLLSPICAASADARSDGPPCGRLLAKQAVEEWRPRRHRVPCCRRPLHQAASYRRAGPEDHTAAASRLEEPRRWHERSRRRGAVPTAIDGPNTRRLTESRESCFALPTGMPRPTRPDRCGCLSLPPRYALRCLAGRMFTSGQVRRAVHDGFIQQEARLSRWELPPPLGELVGESGVERHHRDAFRISDVCGFRTAGATLIAPG